MMVMFSLCCSLLAFVFDTGNARRAHHTSDKRGQPDAMAVAAFSWDFIIT